MKKFPAIIFILMSAILVFSTCSLNRKKTRLSIHAWNDEIIYHIFLRSFYDSNGDLHGDLNGLTEKLGYLKELGITAVLLTPLYESGFYHNYFPTDYEKIDPEYGTKEDFISFVKAVHKNGMKFLMDMETQYAQNGHRWFDESYRNPQSQYSGFIYYSDSLNQFPEQIFMPSKSPLYFFKAWPGNEFNIVLLNLNNRVVKDWMTDFYIYWVDPDKDGNFGDGVDGFRIDHIMDDLDYKGIFTNMYRDFWRPIFDKCKSVNPDLFILGEQANWGEYGEKMIAESGASAAFNFPLRFSLFSSENDTDMFSNKDKIALKTDVSKIRNAVNETLRLFGNNPYVVNFLENHDTERWATVVNGNEDLLRTGAVLNLMLPGIPSIYYGQELGVTGKPGDWGYDVNHIPVREAFPWAPDPEFQGTAVFYKGTGPWWDQSYFNSGETEKTALSVQRSNPNSLWNFYRKLIQFRKEKSALKNGGFEWIETNNPELLAFSRGCNNEEVTVLLNLSEKQIKTKLPVYKQIEISQKVYFQNDTICFNPYGFVIFSSKR